jgi:hypothetical protein
MWRNWIEKVSISTHKSNVTVWCKDRGEVDPVLNLIKHYAMKKYGGVEVELHHY